MTATDNSVGRLARREFLKRAGLVCLLVTGCADAPRARSIAELSVHDIPLREFRPEAIGSSDALAG